MTVPDWVGTIAPAFTALAAWAALVFSIYNAYALRRDRKPRVEMRARWNLPSDSPQVMRGPGSPATADPGRTIFECEITNVGMVGVKIRGVHVDSCTTWETYTAAPSAGRTTEEARQRGFAAVVVNAF